MAPKSRELESVNYKIDTWNTNRPRKLYFNRLFLRESSIANISKMAVQLI